MNFGMIITFLYLSPVVKVQSKGIYFMVNSIANIGHNKSLLSEDVFKCARTESCLSMAVNIARKDNEKALVMFTKTRKLMLPSKIIHYLLEMLPANPSSFEWSLFHM